jgi:translation initiation factor IF-1
MLMPVEEDEERTQRIEKIEGKQRMEKIKIKQGKANFLWEELPSRE